MKSTLHTILRSNSLKFVTIGIISLLLLIPVAMIRGLIDERQHRSEEAIAEVSQKWGLAQKLTGPYLDIPLKEIQIKNEKQQVIHKNLHLLPEELDVVAKVSPREKKRGIYRIVVYNANIQLKGSLRISDEIRQEIAGAEISNQQIFLCLGISDLRGIRDLQIRLDGETLAERPGLPNRELAGKGIHIPLGAELLEKDQLDFLVELQLDGSEQLSLTPTGKVTSMHLASDWPDPSFRGAFLPDPELTEISTEGFEAVWKVNYLNRNYPQHWYGNNEQLEESEFGVEFMMPAENYQKTERSVKYAFMFIALTFAIFFLTELISGSRLHPIQYLLTGASLVVFYTLLLSLSEHLGFNAAYLISAAATTLLISLYVGQSSAKSKQGLLTGALLVLIYGFLFTTLQMKDLSLLLGSIGLFTVIALIMFVSRKINWYKEEEEKETGELP